MDGNEQEAGEKSTETTGISEDDVPLPTWGTFDCGGGLREISTLKVVEEYLEYHGLHGTQASFLEDVEKAGLKRRPSQAGSVATSELDKVLVCFDAGHSDDFLVSWENVMSEVFCKGQIGRALELRLRAYFATFRARQILLAGGEPDAKGLHEDLEPFRLFLNERGVDEIGVEDTSMSLFALPFVQRPYAQEDVGEVFTAKWVRALRADVESSLHSTLPQVPLLYDIVEQPPAGLSEDGAWQAVWADLFRLADSSLDAAAMVAMGSRTAPGPLVEGRRQLAALRVHVPGGFELPLSSEPPLVSSSSRRQRYRNEVAPSRNNLRTRSASALPPRLPKDMDFRRLATFIASHALAGPSCVVVGAGVGSMPSPALDAVLRAVLQRLASAETPATYRRGFLVCVACFDCLGVRSQSQTLPALLSNPGVTELTLGILAVLACEAIGRTYVAANLACIQSLVELLVRQPLDSSLHIQALAALQRLSLRRAPQDVMIRMGLVEWVIGVLSKWQEEAMSGMPSEFSLEFGSAMLMNLALRTAAKRICAQKDVLTVALNLMEHWNQQIRTHINGTLYSLLTHSGFRARAKHAGLEGVLRSIHAHATSLGNDIESRQIEYLLEHLNLADDAEAEGAESGEDDDDDNENFLEEEELASVLLGDRSLQSAAEALRTFLPSSAVVVESQQREFQAFLAASDTQR